MNKEGTNTNLNVFSEGSNSLQNAELVIVKKKTIVILDGSRVVIIIENGRAT